jgi:hypothetical protein
MMVEAPRQILRVQKQGEELAGDAGAGRCGTNVEGNGSNIRTR